MGPNALPPVAGDGPWLAPGWSAALGMAFQGTVGPAGGADWSSLLPFRLEAAFGQRASLLVEGSPLELWAVSPSTQQSWDTPLSSGVSQADVRIEAKFFVWGGNRYLPAFTVRALTKTTTGKNRSNRRFLDAPGYLFDLLMGKRFTLTRQLGLEVWLNVGFLAWQQAQFGQNDAPAFSASASLTTPAGAALRLELRGYAGWQQHDKPFVIALIGEHPVKKGLSVGVGLSQSVSDPVSTELRATLKWSQPAAW